LVELGVLPSMLRTLAANKSKMLPFVPKLTISVRRRSQRRKRNIV
jgi:hypothetical protein